MAGSEDTDEDEASTEPVEASPSPMQPPPAPGSLVARGRAFLPTRHWKDTQEAQGTFAFRSNFLCSHVTLFAVQ